MDGLENIYDLYRNIINDKKEQNIAHEDKTSSREDSNKLFRDVNKQISKNEEQKRQFKKTILKTVTLFTCIQLVFFNAVVLFVIISLTVDSDFFVCLSLKTTAEILNFLKYFIGATVVELLGMLLFIIKYVFSDTINSLVKE